GGDEAGEGFYLSQRCGERSPPAAFGAGAWRGSSFRPLPLRHWARLHESPPRLLTTGRAGSRGGGSAAPVIKPAPCPRGMILLDRAHSSFGASTSLDGQPRGSRSELRVLLLQAELRTGQTPHQDAPRLHAADQGQG